MREARKKKDLTQQELSDLSHVSVTQIANIEKGQMNPSYLILRALAKVLNISLDSLINPDVSPEDEGANQMKMLYSSCPSEMRETLLHHTGKQCPWIAIRLPALLVEGFPQAPMNAEFHSAAARPLDALNRALA